jgi:hypothetical protein
VQARGGCWRCDWNEEALLLLQQRLGRWQGNEGKAFERKKRGSEPWIGAVHWYDFNGRIQLLQTAAKTREASMKI